VKPNVAAKDFLVDATFIGHLKKEEGFAKLAKTVKSMQQTSANPGGVFFWHPGWKSLKLRTDKVAYEIPDPLRHDLANIDPLKPAVHKIPLKASAVILFRQLWRMS